MIQNPVGESKGAGVTPAGMRVGLAILAASTVVMTAWIAFLIWIFARLL